MLGSVGSLSLLVAFVACLGACAAYVQSTRAEMAAPGAGAAWKRIADGAWHVSGLGVFVATAVLATLLLTHQYQYAYVYQSSSNDLKLGYLVSTLWSRQEGSFLLWIVMNVLLGWSLLRWSPASWRAPVMTFVALCQAFLISMIVGIPVGSVTIGASPFLTLAERFPEAPMLQVPGFVPPDGQGLNDLLRNPWMVIHPPTLFMGFAAMLAPFSFALAALWQRRYTEWFRPALPWMLMGVLILGIGITLGGYWAYVTLSFGGYWAWDPVENSSFVPWLLGVAALHGMLVYKKSGAASKSALLLSILAFVAVVYSTFLTRSGILGDISVHSFVDLGLSGQLVVWIGTMTAAAAWLLATRWKEIPVPEREAPPLSREFLTFSGAMLLVALAAAILLGTSAPIFGRLFRDDPAGVPISFYNEWSLPITIAFTLLVGVGQLLWWNKMTVAQLNRVVFPPLLLAVASTLGVMFLTPFVERSVRGASASAPLVQAGVTSFFGQYGMGLGLLLLVLVAFFALYGNLQVAWRVGRGNPKLVGGALAHVGLAVTLLGIVASSGFSRALGGGGGVEMPVVGGTSRDNFVLTRGETRQMGSYTFTYTGRTTGMDGHPAFQLDATDPRGRSLSVKPVAYQTDKGQWIQHPDVHAFAEQDLYVAVSPAAMFENPADSLAKAGELELRRGTGTTLGENEYQIAFVDFETNLPVDSVRGVDASQVEIAVAARLDVTKVGTNDTRTLRPVYVVLKDGTQRFVPAQVPTWGVGFAFTGMNITTESAKLAVEGVEVMPKDWVVVQAYEKPLISLVWIGITLLTLGFLVAFVRRIGEATGRRTLATA